jgi:hypothetical protein
MARLHWGLPRAHLFQIVKVIEAQVPCPSSLCHWLVTLRHPICWRPTVEKLELNQLRVFYLCGAISIRWIKRWSGWLMSGIGDHHCQIVSGKKLELDLPTRVDTPLLILIGVVASRGYCGARGPGCLNQLGLRCQFPCFTSPSGENHELRALFINAG